MAEAHEAAGAPDALQVRRTNATPVAAGKVLRDLAATHTQVLARAGETVRMAHPFSAAPMPFVVTPLAHNQQLLASCGLTGPCGRLP